MTNNTTASMLTDKQIDAIANDGHRNVAGGIYAHHVHDFARDVERALVTSPRATVVPPGWKLVPIEPTEDMIVDGFESWPDQFFSKPEVWASFERMSGCQRAAHKAKLCYTAMLDAAPVAEASAPFQARVQPWMLECFGPTIAADRIERNHRFLEEVIELVQSLGCTASEAHQLVDYTFGRPVGEPMQEVGGVMVTLAALCLASELDMHQAGETELARISEPAMVLKIRAKQAAKPKHSPLPQAVAARAPYEWRDTGPLSILRRRQVEVVTGLSRSTIYDRMKVGTFPAAVKIGPHSVGWRAGDIDAFLANPAGYRAQGGRS